VTLRGNVGPVRSLDEARPFGHKPLIYNWKLCGLEPPARELDSRPERAILGSVTQSTPSRARQIPVGLGTIALSLAALSMAIVGYFL
jgi:hypothetical protein